jgi:hypothetical protein
MKLFINCSPKIKKSNSEYFINLIKEKDDKIIYLYNNNLDNMLKEIKNSNIIIFVFPLYIDTFPSKLIELIENIDSFENKYIYSICNCGFLEAKHNTLVLDNLEYIVKKKNGNFNGYLNIGSGEIFGICKKNKLLKIFCLNLYRKVKKIKKKFKNNVKFKYNIQFRFFNKKLFCIVCNKYWKRKIIN